MALLQPRLSLKVAQRQILTPGLMQMVSVLALNKLELKEMINTEIVENPVLEELEENVPLLDDVAGQEAERERPAEEIVADAQRDKTDPFEEVDFGSYFQEYLDPGFRSPNNYELMEKPSFENFLSQPSTLADHLFWQLGSLILTPEVHDAAEYIVGNIDECGYLTATDEELLEGYLRERVALNTGSLDNLATMSPSGLEGVVSNGVADPATLGVDPAIVSRASALLACALKTVQQMDPLGIAARNLRECLLIQIRAHGQDLRLARERHIHGQRAARMNDVDPEDVETPPLGEAIPGDPTTSEDSEAGLQAAIEAEVTPLDEAPLHDARIEISDTATHIIDKHLSLLQKRDLRELAKAVGKSVEHTQQAFDLIRTLDPRPGQRYNRSDARLIEPDVAFVKRDNEYVVVMNEDDLPTLRLNQGYRRMLKQDGTEKDVKDYVKERYRSALQLIRNIEQRKNTILRTCESIVRRQHEFLERGVEHLKPMMIKEVAEEIGVHPSTVSRAVSNKYVHTAQGVFELRFFFSEGVNGPEGAGTPLMLLKRKVKKLIEEEDARKPLTDDQLAHLLQTQGINVTRRTVAKYREDLRIPSTHQRRKRD
ncbi:RNA polymerase sigma-54 factor RpoN [Acidisarcina polymorpha]|uniref:RNA polymerase sigma-54 factor RpoN n=1 Tax=Acidisarcina polymorpha TaxID=2211140 RepID=A0A2Z5FZC8_9BACT|nr:RNA polymerase factor sigma-54 [Acidisarcina polymorpha]AXC11765.1 RNA polymerase sigma-54 factor RpoN [Acidisarcina polymorpha]